VRFQRFLADAACRPPAIVLQVSYANGLGVIRDLGRHGVPVLGMDDDPASLGFSSRFAAGLVCPDPQEDEEAFLTFLLETGARLPQKAVLFPTHDEYIWPLSRHADRLEECFIIPFSRWPVMQRLHDKRAQLEAAWRAGVDTPKTVFIDGRDDMERALSEVPYPAVLKPTDSLVFKQRFHRHLIDVASPADMDRIWPQVQDLGTVMLQERVPGGDDQLFTVGSYLDAGSRALAVFTGHKIRQHPAGAGSCRLSESRWDAALADAGLRLLVELRYHGVSQVEFKRDARDGRFCLMEVNARHWMWHALATASGVNLSLVAYSDAIGRPFLAPRQRDGGKWIVATKDVPLGVRELWRRHISPAAWARSMKGVRVDGVLSVADPLPGLRNVGRVTRQIVTRQPSARARI
jgi:predicted ATP-grasp superfamily ATP-dependent carboligase